MQPKIQVLLFVISLTLLSSCGTQNAIKDGKTAYTKKQYSLAQTLLEKEYAKSDSRVAKGKIAYLNGLSYKNTGQQAQSSKWFKIAYDNQYGVEALKEYAFALKSAENYKDAETAFKNLGQEIGSPFEYRKEITACQSAQRWKELSSENNFKIKPLSLNTANDEYAPYLNTKTELFITADRPPLSKKLKYMWTGNGFSDLYKVNSDISSIEKMPEPISTCFNEGSMAMNTNCDEIVFTRCFALDKSDQYCKLMSSNMTNGEWSIPQVLAFQAERINYMHPAFANGDNILYFSSDDPNGVGGYDLYYSSRIKNTWSDPKILPLNINTSGNEKFPYSDHDTLYFASDGIPGMGGLDIYKTTKSGTNTFYPPINLQAPMNSGADDFGLCIDQTFQSTDKVFKKGYFSSNRPEGMGKDDIYAFELVKAEPKPIVQAPGDLYLDVFVLEKILKDPSDPNSKVLARKPLVNASLDLNDKENPQHFDIINGENFSIKIEANKNYNFSASSTGFLNATANFSSIGILPAPGKDQRFELDIVLDKIFKNKEIILENIYYDFDKWDIRQDAIPTLNKLTGILKSNPDIKIQLSSHTDCRGTSSYNENLSQKRAQSVVDYLISQGIAPERLNAVGYGESKPAINCECNKCTEEEYQTNRRTSFTILE